MSCLEYKSFLEKYEVNLEENPLSKGTYGRVYLSKDRQYVVKIQKIIPSIFREICILKQFRHPNICPLEDISFGPDGNVLIAMPFGLELPTVYLTKKIALRELLTDIVSGIAFLNSNSIVHGDLKQSNVIVRNGRAQLIDVGISKFTEEFEFTHDGKIMRDNFTSDLLYTFPFRDPESDPRGLNSIKTEMYSIAATIYYMHARTYKQGGSRKLYFNKQDFFDAGITDLEIIDLLLEFQKPISERKNINELMDHPALIKERIDMFWNTNLIPIAYHNKEILERLGLSNFSILFNWILTDMVKRHNFYIPVNILFLGMDLFLRFSSRYIYEGGDILELKTSLVTALKIASSLYDYYINDDVWANILNNEVNEIYLTEMACKYYNVLEGNWFSYTPYNYLNTLEDLVHYYQIMNTSDYSNQFSYSFGEDNDPQKVKKYNLMLNNDLYRTISETPIYKHFEELDISVTPVKNNKFDLYLRSKSYQLIINRLSSKAFFTPRGNDDYYRLMGWLVTFRRYLKDINPESALELFDKLINNYKLSRSTALLERFFPETEINLLLNIDVKYFQAVNIFSVGDELNKKPSIIIYLEEKAKTSKGNFVNYRVLDREGNLVLELSTDSKEQIILEAISTLEPEDPNIIDWEVEISKTKSGIEEWVESFFKDDDLREFKIIPR